MEFDEVLGIFLWVLVIIASIYLIVLHRKGKMGLVMTIGLIITGIGMAYEVPLPTVAPGLANVPIKASWISVAGLLLVNGSLWATLIKRRKGSKAD